MNKRVNIYSYKYDGKIHRIYNDVNLISEDNSKFVLLNNYTRVFEANLRVWVSKEPTLYFYYKERYFNVIATLRDDGIYYYCNLASPSILDSEGIKYVDFDLDVKFDPKGNFKIVDINEFKKHEVAMNYNEHLYYKLQDEINYLIKAFKSKITPFNYQENMALFNQK